ncbi:hypothetical protein D9M68_822040 [compost metagenome]
MASSLSARERLSRKVADTLMSRPCSSQVYQDKPTPANVATSSRRSPGVRRRLPVGKPTSSGEMRSRRLRRNSASSTRVRSAVRGALIRLPPVLG